MLEAELTFSLSPSTKLFARYYRGPTVFSASFPAFHLQRLRGTGNQVTRPGFHAGKHSPSFTTLKKYTHPVDGALEIRLAPLPGSTRDGERDS